MLSPRQIHKQLCELGIEKQFKAKSVIDPWTKMQKYRDICRKGFLTGCVSYHHEKCILREFRNVVDIENRNLASPTLTSDECSKFVRNVAIYYIQCKGSVRGVQFILGLKDNELAELFLPCLKFDHFVQIIICALENSQFHIFDEIINFALPSSSLLRNHAKDLIMLSSRLLLENKKIREKSHLIPQFEERIRERIAYYSKQINPIF